MTEQQDSQVIAAITQCRNADLAAEFETKHRKLLYHHYLRTRGALEDVAEQVSVFVTLSLQDARGGSVFSRVAQTRETN
jgi:hypothetical protein